MKLDVITLDAAPAGSIELDDAIFGLEPRADILHRVVRWQLAKRQAGTHSTLGKSEVSYSTKKIVRQKGSGGARHGSRKAPIFRHGRHLQGPGAAQPRPRPEQEVPGARAEARAVGQGRGRRPDRPRPRRASPRARPRLLAQALKGLGWKRVLVIDGAEVNANFALAARNIDGIDVLPSVGANVYDILRRDTLVLTKAGVEALEARLK